MLVKFMPVVHGTMGCGQKNYKASVAVPPAPVQVPSQRPLAPSVASVTSVTNDKGDNEMIPGAVHRSPVTVKFMPVVYGAMCCGQKKL